MVTLKAATPLTETGLAGDEPRIPNGYKQTEAGIVPKDWLDCTVGDLIDFEGGSQPAKSTFSPSLKPEFIRLIQIRDYKTDKFETYVPRNLARRFCTENDIMIGRYGPPIFQILRGLSGAYNVALIKAKPRPAINQNYAYYFLKQEGLFAFIDKLSQRSSGQTGVDLKELRAYPLPLPPTQNEQETIAEALTDTDTFIEFLEQIIAKKRQIKQASMQELLIGKKRLPGFEKVPGYKQTDVGNIPNDWQVKVLDDLFSFSGGLSASRAQLGESGYCYLHYGDIHTSTKSVVDVEAQQLDLPKLDLPISAIPRKSMLADGDVVFVDASEDDEGASKHCVVLNPRGLPFISGLHTIVSKSKGADLPKSYKRHCFQTKSVKKQFLFYSVGTKVTGISKTNIKKILLPLPPTKAEQESIAAILSDMDVDIAALEEKLAKARQIKQGMMQELLTGKVRLV